MQELVERLFAYGKGVWRYRWWAVAIAWLVALGGWLAVAVLPNRYESSTQVYVDTESLLKPLLSGLAVSNDSSTQVSMMQAVMLSRPNLAKVAETNDLMLGARGPEEREAVISSLESRITLTNSVDRKKSTNVFVVSFLDNNPKIAHSVVQTLLDTFMEDSLGLKRSDASLAQRFLKSQVAEYEQRLFEGEQRLATFKKQNVGLMPGTEGDYYTRMETESTKLQQLRSRAAQLSDRRSELIKQLQQEPETVAGGDTDEFNPIDAQIAKYQASVDELLLKYTEKHPQVVSLKQNIAQLQKEKEAGATVSASAPPLDAGLSASDQLLQRSLSQNPVYQGLRMSLSQLDVDMAQLRSEMRMQESVVEQLRARMDAIPEVEAELARLNRDYEVNKEQYDALLARLESAKLSGQAEQNSENVKFRVIEPPTVPHVATWPNRGALNTLVLLMSLAAGIGFALLLSLLRPTIASREVLQRVTGLTVLGSISSFASRSFGPWYRRQPLLVGSLVGLLLVVYVLNLVLYEPLMDAMRRGIG